MMDEDLAHRESLWGERAGYRETRRGFNAVGGSQHKVLGDHCEGLFSGKVIILEEYLRQHKAYWSLPLERSKEKSLMTFFVQKIVLDLRPSFFAVAFFAGGK